MNHACKFLCVLLLAGAACAPAATMYSLKSGYMGAGTFFGPGRIKDTSLFDAQINHIAFPSALAFVTPFENNGGSEPNICGERQTRTKFTGMLSDNLTKINENVDVCAFEVNNMRILAAIIDGGFHGGQQVAVALQGGEMVMTMDFALDLGIGAAGIIKMPFYGTTGEVTVPASLQTQLKLPGGIDRAGSLKAGTRLRGRLGDFNHDGMLDGAIVVAGNIPLTSVFMPGAPYALIRYFETNIPYTGHWIGKLPGNRPVGANEPPALTVVAPATAALRPSGSAAQSH
ncbi:MAG: hypothetical protein JWO52_1260 [Gammaproteobacteria bacterium]|nr:hypothetical protein [Gammaproteobacteria bacterium]